MSSAAYYMISISRVSSIIGYIIPHSLPDPSLLVSLACERLYGWSCFLASRDASRLCFLHPCRKYTRNLRKVRTPLYSGHFRWHQWCPRFHCNLCRTQFYLWTAGLSNSFVSTVMYIHTLTAYSKTANESNATVYYRKAVMDTVWANCTDIVQFQCSRSHEKLISWAWTPTPYQRVGRLSM